MEFAESESQWKQVPSWVNYLIYLGYGWKYSSDGKRRLAILSMPCDSSAAGLVALGATLHRLETKGACDRAMHFTRIAELALRPDPTAKLIDRRQKRRAYRGPYVVDGVLDGCFIRARHLANPEITVSISEATSCNWQFVDEPPVEVIDGQGIAYRAFYEDLVVNANPNFDLSNLNQSDSDICMAGRATGDEATRQMMRSVAFKRGQNEEATVFDLLPIYSWHPQTVSRISFFNCRNRTMDRICRDPRLVIADGDLAVLAALQKFPNSDVFGIVDRSADRERSEMVGQYFVNQSQWYEPDFDQVAHLEAVPKGMSLAILRVRN